MNSRIKLFQRLYQLRTVATEASVNGESGPLRLYVNKLPWTVSTRELQNYFSQFGPIAKAEVIFNKKTGFSRGFGYVTYEMTKSYVKALQIEQHVLEGNLLEISQAKNVKESEDDDVFDT